MNFSRPLPFYRSPVLWVEHHSNGGTGIQRFAPEEAAFFTMAVGEFGNPGVWVRDGALHSSLGDLSDFWDFVKAHPGYPAYWERVKTRARTGVLLLPEDA